jgi:hypothetical protein
MVAASELNKIRRNLINEGLGTFYCLFGSTHSSLGIKLLPDTAQIIFSTAAAAGITQLS